MQQLKFNIMKLQLDLDEKIIRIEQNVNLGDFFSKLEQLFPDLKWREFTLEAGNIIYWSNPISIPWVVPEPPYLTCPWRTYTTTFDLAGDVVINSSLTSGVYNIDIS